MKKEMYDQKANMFKVLSDGNRLQIIHMLSCGELCACDILEKFNITQPTLSHHMKVLKDAGLVNSYKNSSWTIYSLNVEILEEINLFLKHILNDKHECICKK